MTPPGTGGAGGAAMPPASAGEAGQCSLKQSGGVGKDPGGEIPVCCTPAATDKAMIDEVFRLLNAHRAANGVAALTYDPKLEHAIQGHCQHMAQHPFFAHASPEAKVASFSTRASLCGTSAAGENIAYNQRTAEQVMNTWKNSAGHNTNMLSKNYRRVGIGQYQLRWGQIFGR